MNNSAVKRPRPSFQAIDQVQASFNSKICCGAEPKESQGAPKPGKDNAAGGKLSAETIIAKRQNTIIRKKQSGKNKAKADIAYPCGSYRKKSRYQTGYKNSPVFAAGREMQGVSFKNRRRLPQLCGLSVSALFC